MIEVFRNSSEYIYHTVYVAGVPTNTVEVPVVRVYDPKTAVISDPGMVEAVGVGKYRFRLPFSLTKSDGPLRSIWTYTVEGEQVVTEVDFEVVTPYVTVEEILNLYPELGEKSYDEIKNMERRVRLIINKYTGQQFGSRIGTVSGTLTPEGTMDLDERVYYVHYYTVNGYAGNLQELNIINSGWTVRVTPTLTGYYHVKSDTHYHVGGKAMSVVLAGSFGWSAVPNEVNQAARMLIGDYFCNDAIYRQKGVQAVRAADWRLDFHDKAFEGTGNLDVDRLLSKFHVINMVII